MALLGDLNWDLVFCVPKLPGRGGEVLGGEGSLRLGGSATNTARFLAKFGFEVRLFAAVGEDPLGELALHKLAKEGLTTAFLKSAPMPTGICCALVDSQGERTLLTSRGANASLGPALPVGWLDGVDWLHLSGYALLEPLSRAALFAAASQARTRGIPVSLDPGMVSVHHHGHFFRELGPVEVFLPNELEASALLGGGSLEEDAFRLLSFGKRVFLKLGARGCLALAGEQSVRAPAVPVEVRDPVGAGDAFNAGVVAAALWGGGLQAQALMGVLLGTLSAAGLSLARRTALELLEAMPFPEKEETKALILDHWP